MLEVKETGSIIYLGKAAPASGSGGGGTAGSEPVGATFGTTSSAGTRTGQSANYTFTASTTVSPGQNDFRTNRPEYQTQGVLWEKDGDGKFTKKIAEEGSSTYDRLHSDREYTGLRTVKFNKFYYRIQRETDGSASYQTHYTQKSGFAIHPAFLMGNKTNEHLYLTKYKLCNDGSGGATSVPGGKFLTNMSQATFQTKCRAVGMVVMPKHCWDMVSLLAIIQCNNYSIQAAINNGQVDGWKTTKVSVAQTDANSVIVANANATQFSTERTLWCKNAYRKILAIEAYDDDNKRITIDATLTTTTSDDVYAGPNVTGFSDAILSPDGYNQTLPNGMRTTVLLGLEDFWGGPNCGLAGMVRINGNQSLVSPDPVINYEWPTATDDKGWVAGPAMLTADGYPGRFAANSEVNGQPWLFVSANNDGTSSAPTGDRTYANADTTVKMCYGGGGWFHGGSAGLFCADWVSAASHSNWPNGARGVLDPRLVG